MLSQGVSMLHVNAAQALEAVQASTSAIPARAIRDTPNGLRLSTAPRWLNSLGKAREIRRQTFLAHVDNIFKRSFLKRKHHRRRNSKQHWPQT